MENALNPKNGLQVFMDWLDLQNTDVLVSHNNMNFDSIILKNSMSKFAVKRPRNGFDNWYFVDSLQLMRDAMPHYHGKSLDNCMDYYFRECQPTPHSLWRTQNASRDCAKI